MGRDNLRGDSVMSVMKKRLKGGSPQYEKYRNIIYGALRYLLNVQHDSQVHIHTPTQTQLGELRQDASPFARSRLITGE